MPEPAKLDYQFMQIQITQPSQEITVQHFRQKQNQFGHSIRIRKGNEPELVLLTHHHRDSNWPTSPPIQDVHFEDRIRSQVLLSVGMAGKSHYSLSIESNLKNLVRFEFACHVKEQPEYLGVTYWLQTAHPDSDEMLMMFKAHESSILQRQLLDSQNFLEVTPMNLQSELPTTIVWGFDLNVE